METQQNNTYNETVRSFANRFMIKIYWNTMLLYSFIELKFEPYLNGVASFSKPYINNIILKLIDFYRNTYNESVEGITQDCDWECVCDCSCSDNHDKEDKKKMNKIHIGNLINKLSEFKKDSNNVHTENENIDEVVDSDDMSDNSTIFRKT